MAYNKPRRPRTRKFEEEEAKTSEETTTEEGGEEESTPDSSEQLVQILVDMGLSADQAEAVYQMAQDLVNTGAEESAEKQEMRRARARRRMARARREKMGRARRPHSRGRRAEFSERPSRRPLDSRRPSASRGRRFSDDNRMEAQLRRQRREILELKRQLREFGAQPAAAPARTQSAFASQTPMAPQGNSILDRVMAKMKG